MGVNGICNRSAVVRGRARIAHGAQEEHGREATDSSKGVRQGYQPFVKAHGRIDDRQQLANVDCHQRRVAARRPSLREGEGCE